MKKSLLVLFITGFFIQVYCQENTDVALKNAITNLRSAESYTDFMQAKNKFQLICNKEVGNWLPYYYVSYCCIKSNYLAASNDEKDLILDEAEKYLQKADSIYKLHNNNKNEIELVLLRAFLIQSRYTVDPGNRAQKLAPLATQMLELAHSIDDQNPRYYYLKGESIYYTPKLFGGGKKNAQPYLETAINKYNTYKSPSELYPDWGKQRTQQLLNSD